LGARLHLCIADEAGKIDDKHCFENLLAKREKFMTNVAQRADAPAR
jgi:hypothetical protein